MLLNAERTAHWGGRAVLTWRLGAGYCSTTHRHADNMHTHSSRSGMAVKQTQANEDGRVRQQSRKTGRKVDESEEES